VNDLESTIKTTHKINDNIRTRFEESKRVLSFDEYLALVVEDPYKYLRDSAHYVLDAIESFGNYDVSIRGQIQRRYKLFDQEFTISKTPVVGQEKVQNQFTQVLTSFVRSGKTNKLVVLHGPNGSAKSSFVRALFEGLENYSHTADGHIFHFSWIFPVESFEKTGMGISTKREAESTVAGANQSYAKLDPQKVGAVVRSELHENPIFLIPKSERRSLFQDWLSKCKSPKTKENLLSLQDTFLNGELSHKNALIFEALLNDYNGDFRKILRHVRVERLYLSKRFRKGIVSVEPQFGVDASIRQVTLDRSMANLPPALQSLNLFQLEGDLVDGNRGLIEFNDFLKRPLEHFKYLLGTCETGTVNLSHVVAFLDTLFIATTDERHLEAFREHPEYPSFKSRLEFIKVPYLLRWSEEEKIYSETAKRAVGPKELMPHTTRVLALWAVLSRLKKPLLKNKSTTLTRILENMPPLAKARLYDSGEIPEKLTDEERRELRSHLEELIDEQQSQPYYEGLLGPSARELKAVIQSAAQNDQFLTLGPTSIFSELRKIVKRPMDFEYLRLEPNHGYHAFEELIDVVNQEWLNWVDREMRLCLELQNDAQFIENLNKYMNHVTHHIRSEKVKNRITGKNEDPDQDLMIDFENQVGASGDIEEFRKNLISRLGAWSIENSSFDKSKGLPFETIFPDLLEKLHKKHHDAQVAKIRTMGEVLIDSNAFATIDKSAGRPNDTDTLSESKQMALKVYEGLQKKFGYGKLGAKEALVALMKARYINA
jgi:serine protein kinase